LKNLACITIIRKKKLSRIFCDPRSITIFLKSVKFRELAKVTRDVDKETIGQARKRWCNHPNDKQGAL
jgi:hypothetical protein